MKAIKYISVAIFSALSLIACQDDSFNATNKDIRIFADSNVKTRVAFHEDESANKTYVTWEEMDAISLYTKGQVPIYYQAMTTENSNQVEFVKGTPEALNGEEGDSVYAYFPAYKNYPNDTYTNDGIEINCDNYSTFLYAKSKVENNQVHLTFKHLFAYLKLTVTENLFPKDCHPQSMAIWGEHILQGKGTFNLSAETLSIEEGINQVSMDINLENGSTSMYIPILPQPDGTRLTFYYFGEDGWGDFLFARTAPKGGFKAGHVYILDTGSEKELEEMEKQKKALIALYHATHGESWVNNTNWLSDKPIYEWYGVNNNEYRTIESPYVVMLNLDNNGLYGQLPPEFADLMNSLEAGSLDISGNGIYGPVPDAVKQHSEWDNFGWNIIQQNPWNGGRIDMTNINLRMENEEVEYLDESQGETNIYDILRKNKVNHIMIDTPSDAFANIHLSYHNKGYATIIAHQDWMGATREETIQDTKDYPIKDMIRLWKSLGDGSLSGLSGMGNSFLIDDEGYLIEMLNKDWGAPESYYTDIVDSILYARLGEPEEHPIFSTEYYTSTDYSRDGEVVTLQTASVGKGIDLVFMGDAYVDRDMETGGKYETDMKQSMEYFFSIEPYKSFRNRFNVYAVKVISGTEYISDQSGRMDLRIGMFMGNDYGGDDNICFEYASKIPDIDLDNATIVNVVNNPNDFFISGYTNMYDTGASVAHIDVGGPSEVIIHEAGGHGVAKLLDEYIYEGYENVTATTEDKASFDSYYKSRGWGANIDFTNSPDEIQWAHLLKDERYANEVGIYEGAYLWAKGVYRPTEKSVMNQDYSWFNAPSREAIYKAIMRASEGDNWTYDFEDFASYDAINRTMARSAKSLSTDKRKVIHRPPTFIKSPWQNNTVVPYR